VNNLKSYEYASLLLKVLPYVSKEKIFALKGGTAINLFLRDLPRLSVDIDLTYLPLQNRDESFMGIHEGLKGIKTDIENSLKDARVTFVQVRGISVPTTLTVQQNAVSIKIETNLVLRGAVYAPQIKVLCKQAQNVFQMYTEIQTLSIADIYGGKICAALDRQHPRDLFDVMLLLKTEGITDEIRKAFLVYLASHSRPMSELLAPNLKDIREVFERDFVGMTTEPVDLDSLLEARERMLKILKQDFTDDEKAFLISIKECDPRWEKLGIAGIEKLPGVQWKLANIKKMPDGKRALALAKLKEVLF